MLDSVTTVSPMKRGLKENELSLSSINFLKLQSFPR